MEHRGKKLNSFAVIPTRNGKNILIELRDLEECGRSSVRHEIHAAVQKCLNKMINRNIEDKHESDDQRRN